ncbi:hypothetical protein [Flavobacterium aquidurense]|uniref:Uncharacterized protein n=1 Tax=Flavobacterium aquidurense TaxID=362413 RepID=A0A0Q0RYV3_9FLAO|nr:hypothetical protein [Flavobacterium aquidurense]KQB42670.1 hypothetical protein RC62_3677 [Flavobacterium aquidurense]
MENTINTNTPDEAVKNINNYYPAIYFLCAGLGSLAVGSALKMFGKNQMGSVISKFTMPLIAVGLYKTLKNISPTENTEQTNQNVEQIEKE